MVKCCIKVVFLPEYEEGSFSVRHYSVFLSYIVKKSTKSISFYDKIIDNPMVVNISTPCPLHYQVTSLMCGGDFWDMKSWSDEYC